MGEVLDALLGFVGAIDVDTGIGVGNRTVLGVGSLSHFSVRFLRDGEISRQRAGNSFCAPDFNTYRAEAGDAPRRAEIKTPTTRSGWNTGGIGRNLLLFFRLLLFLLYFFYCLVM